MNRQSALRRTFSAFRKTIVRYGMIIPGDRILAACSGGPDSVALVELLLRLRGEIPFDLAVAHFNHRLRSGAEDDEAFVRERSEIWRLPFSVGSKNVRLHASRRGLNLEEAARALRYEFLSKTAARSGATRIATGHHMDDQAETVLMRLMRGSGLKGLGGIAPVLETGPVRMIRPLIEVRRADILGFLDQESIPYREDETNRDRRFLRNRIRLDLIPEMERHYAPRIVEHLACLAGIAKEEEGLLDDFVRGLARGFITGTGEEIRLDAKTLGVLPPGLARRIAREFLRQLKGDLLAVSFRDVEALLGLREGKAMSFGKGRILGREKGLVFPTKKPARRPAPRTMLWDGRGRVSLEPSGPVFIGKRKKARISGISSGFRTDDRVRAVSDLDKLSFPLLVRGRSPGDRFRPYGAPGRKKLKEVLRAKGIPREERGRLPVFLSGGDIVWVPGLPVGEKFKVDEGTRTVFVIERVRAVKKRT